ncbi:sensor histidine kinase [Mucilaginibacter aquariorum]|uniref:histidine kinase n=1 Tax=Mucilaginibacter aquariorum TaxID=2967225 RepID=A0ABT1T496_9SPHI|nr:HAMP domain-containing sensor histidine kinase [Mucilaginibacter aquariorum]MCQ6958763.1 HAMP domain-containing histidine kinase [Mucilaginibacter aquariorum]
MKSPEGNISQSFFSGGRRIAGRRLSPKALKGFRLFFYLGCITSLVLVVVMGMASYRALKRQQKLEKWVEHTYKVLRKTDSISMYFNQTMLLGDGFKGINQHHEVTLNTTYHNRLIIQVNNLTALIKDNRLGTKEVLLLKQQIDSLFRTRYSDSQQFRAQLGKINETLLRTKLLEESLLLNRENAYNRSSKQTQVIVVVGSGLILLIVSILIYLILTELKSRIRAYQEEHELNQLKSSFITLASHEFRTPLSSILLSATLIERYLERNDKEPVLKHAEKIRQVVHNLENILEDFLSMDKLEEGLIKPEFSTFDLAKLCGDVMAKFRLTAKAGQRLHYELPNAQQTVNLDSSLIEKALGGLLSNAIKYAGDEAHIWLTTEVTTDKVIISVKDNGVGIAEEDQKKLSTLFYRVDNTGHIAGTGLGLNIVKRYVQLMGGVLELSSVPNKETCFSMSFPIKKL